MPWAVAVSLAGIVEGRLFAQIARPPLDTARRADDFHSVRTFAPAWTEMTAYNSGKIRRGRRSGTTL